MIVILGATGKVGSEVVRQLQAAQQPFRALAHSERSAQLLASRGGAVVRGSFDDPATLALAFQGAEKVFLLTPPRPDQAQVEQAIIDAAKRASIRQIVKLSSFGVDAAALFAQLHKPVETYLKASGVPYTILQAQQFMQNFQESDLETLHHQQAIINPAGEVAISFVDTRDVAALAVAALTSDGHENQTYEVTGPAALTYGQIAALFTQRLGRAIRYQVIEPELFRAGLVEHGLDPWFAALTTELFTYFGENPEDARRVSPDVPRILGRSAYSFDQYLGEHIHLFEA